MNKAQFQSEKSAIFNSFRFINISQERSLGSSILSLKMTPRRLLTNTKEKVDLYIKRSAGHDP